MSSIGAAAGRTTEGLPPNCVPLQFQQPFSAQRGERCSKHLDSTSRLAHILQSLRAEVDRLAANSRAPDNTEPVRYSPPASRRGLHVEVLHRGEGLNNKPSLEIEQKSSRQGHDTPPGTDKSTTVFESRVRSLQGTPVDLSKICFWRGAIIVPTVQQPEMGYTSLSHVTIDYFGIKRGDQGRGITPAQGAALSTHLAAYAMALLSQDKHAATTPNQDAQGNSKNE